MIGGKARDAIKAVSETRSIYPPSADDKGAIRTVVRRGAQREVALAGTQSIRSGVPAPRRGEGTDRPWLR